MLKKSKHISVKTSHKNLSIQFSLDGFSFCVTDANSKRVMSLVAYIFEEKVATPEHLLSKIKQIFNSNSHLQQHFSTINVIHQNSLSSLIPNAYFDENQLASYLNYSIKTLVNDHIVYDDIADLEAKNCYIPFVNINNFLFQNFGEFEYKHHTTVLIEKLLQIKNTGESLSFYVNVSTTSLDIIVFEGRTIQLVNNFNYDTKEDFLYYILFVAEQLNLDPNTMMVTFLGEIDMDSDLYKIAYDYIRHLDFINQNLSFFKDSDEFFQHSNYTLTPQ